MTADYTVLRCTIARTAIARSRQTPTLIAAAAHASVSQPPFCYLPVGQAHDYHRGAVAQEDRERAGDDPSVQAEDAAGHRSHLRKATPVGRCVRDASGRLRTFSMTVPPIPACVWFLRVSKGQTIQNPSSAQPPEEKNCGGDGVRGA